MQPAFALARARLAETKEEFDSFLEAEREQLAPLEGDSRKSAEWMRAVTRASGIEGVYTGMENVLREVLNVTDDGVSGSPASFHAQLLAQAAERTDKREAIVTQETYKKLDELRGFRHRERTIYRHVLKEELVNENRDLLTETFPKFEAEVAAFIERWERKPEADEEPTSSHNI